MNFLQFLLLYYTGAALYISISLIIKLYKDIEWEVYVMKQDNNVSAVAYEKK